VNREQEIQIIIKRPSRIDEKRRNKSRNFWKDPSIFIHLSKNEEKK